MAAGFMAGFGTNFAKLMEEDRQYFREQAAKTKDYIQTYGTRAVTDREDKANSVMAVVNNLQTRGFKPSTVRYVLDNNGITGLMELQDTASKRTDITKDEIDSIVTKAADYVSKNPDEDMQTVIRRAFGLYKSEANPVKRDRNAFSAILGFDNAMLEDEVLDDMYINGYTGRDIYRIMGSAGPRAGAALQLDLPTEPLSPTAQKLYADVMLDQMEAGIDARVLKLKTDYNKEGSDKMALQKQIDALETLKGRGYDGIATYAKLDPSIFEYAKSLNEDTPGSIVNNGFLYGFESAFNDYFEETRPKVKTKGLTDDDSGLPTVPVGDGLSTKPEPKVMTFKTAEEFNKAVEAGEVAPGQQVKIGSGSVSTFTPPKEEPKKIDLGDMTGAPGFRERDDIPEAVAVAMPEVAPDIDAALNRLPDHLEKLGTQGMDAWRKFTKAVNEYSYTMPSRPLSQRQLTDTPSNTLGFMIVGAMVDTLGEAAETTEDLETFTNVFTRASDTPAYKQLEELIQERKNIPAKKAKKVVEKVQELEVDQAMLGYVQKMDEMGRTPSREEAEKLKTILEQEQIIDTSTDELYRGPISGKTLVEKLDDIWNFYTSDGETEYNPRAIGTVGSRDLGLRDTTDDVRPPRGEAPDRAASLARGASPEEDDLPAEMPRNMAVENFTTRGINATPRGLMTPNRESAPKLGQAEFGDLIKRVHGSSKAAEAFNKKVSSGKLTAADVTRLLKATRKLPETASRQRLIMSLFNLRDGLNKR
jgi:hypothetical protein